MRKTLIATPPTPAVATDWSFTPSAVERVKLLSVTFQISSGTSAAITSPALVIKDDEGNALAVSISGVSIASGSTVGMSFVDGNFSSGGVSVQTICGPLPQFWLPPGATVATSSKAFNAATQYSAIVITYEIEDEYDRTVWIAELAAELAAQMNNGA